jgi:hypothetical protein
LKRTNPRIRKSFVAKDDSMPKVWHKVNLAKKELGRDSRQDAKGLTKFGEEREEWRRKGV